MLTPWYLIFRNYVDWSGDPRRWQQATPLGYKQQAYAVQGHSPGLFKFLQTWDQLMRDLQIPRSQCDFLIPAMQPDGTISEFEPLDYAGTTKIFRAMLMTPWKRFQGDHPLERLQMTYTLRSMKAHAFELWTTVGHFGQ